MDESGKYIPEQGEEKKPKVEITQAPSFERLLEFEKNSWPEEEQATPEQIEGRLNDFPKGIFMLSVDGKDVAQYTSAPKNIGDIDKIDSFKRMRDLPVDLTSKILWGVNIAALPGYQGNGYAAKLIDHALSWARDNGYVGHAGGVTCYGYARRHEEHKVSDIEDYMSKGLNPATRLFRRAAESLGMYYWQSEPIKDYWPEDIDSEGYGVMTYIGLQGDKTDVEEQTIATTDNTKDLSPLPIYNQKPELEFTFDRNNTAHFEPEERRTAKGVERTMIITPPIHGCSYNCEFCTFKNLANPDYRFTPETSERTANDIDGILRNSPDINTIKLFNGGNIMYGSEEKEGFGEMHERLWEILPEILKKYPDMNALEIEVRVDEFSDGASPDGTNRSEKKAIIRQRVVDLAERLHESDIELRIILPFEYIESDLLRKQNKFPKVFTGEGDTATGNADKAIAFLGEHNIPWLSYAMLGGRLKDRPLTSEESVSSAAHTALFALQQGTRECIINSQYIDPMMAWENSRDKVMHHMPTEKDMVETLRLIAPHLHEYSGRVRLIPEKEDLMVGTVGPEISKEFQNMIIQFNNAEDQTAYFEEKLAEY